MPHSYFKCKKIKVGLVRLWFYGRIEEKDLDKSDGTLLSLQISGVTVIGGGFLSVLPQLGGDSGPTLGATAGKEKRSSVFGLNKE